MLGLSFGKTNERLEDRHFL